MNQPGGIAIQGAYAYVTSQTDDAIDIIDISDPTNPTLVGQYRNISVLNDIKHIEVHGKYAYVAHYKNTNGAVTILDISDPDNIVVLDTITNTDVGNNDLLNSYFLKVQGKYAYVASWGGNSVAILDISNPNNIVYVNNIEDINGPGYTEDVIGLDVAGNLLIIAAMTSDAVSMYDITDPTNPSLIEVYRTPNAVPMDGARYVKIVGNYAYVSNSETASAADGGFNIFRIGGIDTPGITAGSIAAHSLDVEDEVHLGNLFVRGGIIVDDNIATDALFATNATVSQNFKVGGVTNTSGLKADGTINFSGTGSHSAAGEWNFNSNTFVIDSGTDSIGIGTTETVINHVRFGNTDIPVVVSIHGADGAAGHDGGIQMLLGGAGGGLNTGGYKLAIMGYDNDGSTTYPIWVSDENSDITASNTADFFLLNRPSASGLSTAYFQGNVGVGVTSPEANLHIASTEDAVIKLQADTDQAGGEDHNPYITFMQDGNTTTRVIIGMTGNTGKDPENTTSTGALANTAYFGTTIDGLSMQFATYNTVRMTIAGDDGFVGIGITNPLDALHVVGDIRTSACAVDAGADVACADIAETYPTSDSMEAGDIVMIDEDYVGSGSDSFAIKKSSSASKVIGVVSTRPAILIEEYLARFGAPDLPGSYDPGDKAPVALAGRIPVKVNLENGPIKAGDPIAPSSVNGVGMKALDPGMVVGMALEPISEIPSGSYDDIMIFINTQWYRGALNDSGELGFGATASSDQLDEASIFDLNILFNSIIKKFASVFDIVFENGLARISKIVTDLIESDDIKTKRIESQSGYTTYDTETGDPYCIQITNGQINTIPGECEAVVIPTPTPEATPTPEITPEVTPEPTESPEPSVSPEPTPEISASPTPEPTPNPTPTPEITPTPTPEATATPTPTPETTPTVEPSPTPEVSLNNSLNGRA